MSEKEKTSTELKTLVDELSAKLEKAEENCRNSKEKFQKALMASNDPVSITVIETGKYIDVNNKFIKEIGYSREELIGKTSLELGIWSNKRDREAYVDLFRKNGFVKNFETEYCTRSGKRGQVLMSSEKIVVDGEDCLLTYSTTITDKKKTENRYKLLAENSTDVIWTMNLEGKFNYISPSVEKLRGYTPKEVINQNLTEVVTMESAQKVSILLKNLIDTENDGVKVYDSFLTEVEQLCKDGTTVWTEVITSPIRDEHGTLVEILGVSRNIQGKKVAEQKAKERSSTVEGIFRSAPVGMGMVIDRVIVMVNDRFCAITGYSKKEIIGKDARIIYESDEEYERVGKIKYNKIRESGTGDIYTKVRKKDETLIDVYLSSSPVDIEDWTKGVVFNLLDLSDIKNAEIQLAANEEKYTSFFNHINDAILVHPWKEDGFHSFIELNDIACKMYGYTRDELLKMNPEDITIPEEIKNHNTKEFRKTIKDTGSMVFETVHVKKSGEKFPVEISSSIINIDEAPLVLAVVRDISERREAEIAIKNSELRYKEMFENSPEPMITLNKPGFITNCNTAFFEVSGREKDDLIGRHFAKTDLFSIKNLPAYLKLFNDVILKDENQVIELDWISTTGEGRKAMAHIGPMTENGKVIGLQALVKDITNQKEFEKNLILAKEKAEESDRLKTSFLETMSHELRTPLNAVIGFSNLISDESNIDSIREMNTYVTENGKKLLSIIESIFDISILETRSTKLLPEDVSLNDLFSDLEITLTGMLELENKSNINAFYQPDNLYKELTIKTDRKRLKQLLTNLLTNAIRYTDKGTIRYGFKVKDENIEFFVTDTGIGIQPDKINLIFEKFRQIDSSSTRTRGGVGLGLSICQEISRLLKGKLKVDSLPGVGSTFYFIMPLSSKDNDENNYPGIDLEGRVFMVVEDVESNYLYLERILTDSGADVLWAQSGEEAITLAKTIDKIDMVLMDIRMPDMNGYDITRAIKNLYPKLPIIAQTAYAMVSDQEEALEAGCSAHISKPIRVNDLNDIIKEHLVQERRPHGLII